MYLRSILSALALCSAIGQAMPFKRSNSFDYGSKKVYGVNLGGWFVLEPWITPSLFEEVNDDSVVDEYSLMAKWGSDAQSKMEAHWDSWITQDDFNQIAQAGLNHVRIPIGYWAFSKVDGDTYVQGQTDRLDAAIGWARSAGLKVLIDLHGVPYSQNGFDNSGRKGSIDWQNKDPGAKATLTALKALIKRYAPQSDVVTSIELVNEPFGVNGALDMNGVKQYYYDGWGSVRDVNQDTVVVIHDAFQDFSSYWQGFMTSGFNNVMVDTHQYQIFSDSQVAMSPSEHVSAACSLGPKIAGTDKWLVVGEWTGAQTDCTQWLNGKGVGARYDGTFSGSSKVGSCDGKYKGTVDGLSSDDKKNIRSFIEAQLDAYNQHTGWFFWTWKAESAPEWHMKDLIAGGLFPQPLSDRQYPGQCS